MNNDDIENVIDFIFSDGYKEITTVNDFLKKVEEKDKEIERLNKQIEEYQKALDETTSEKVDLYSIIKEAREHIEEDIKANYFKRYDDEVYKLCDELLEILDKI